MISSESGYNCERKVALEILNPKKAGDITLFPSELVKGRNVNALL